MKEPIPDNQQDDKKNDPFPWSTGPTASYDVPTPVGADGPVDSVQDIKEGKGLYPTTTEGLTAGYRADFDDFSDILGGAWRAANKLSIDAIADVQGRNPEADLNDYNHTLKLNKYRNELIQSYVPKDQQSVLGSHLLYNILPGVASFFTDIPTLKIAGEGAKLVDIGSKSVFTALGDAVPSLGEDTLKARVVKNALKGTAIGLLGGTASSTVGTAVSDFDGQHVTAPQYFANIMNWTIAGAALDPVFSEIGRVAKPIINPYLKKASFAFKKGGSYLQDKLTSKKPILSEEASINSLNNQAVTTGVESSGTPTQNNARSLNESIEERENENAIYDSLTEEQKEKTLSPAELDEVEILDRQQNIQSLHEDAENIADKISEIGTKDLSEAKKTVPIVSLLNGLRALKEIQNLKESPKLNKLQKSLQRNAYTAEPAATVTRMFGKPKENATADEQVMATKLHSPEFESEELDKHDKFSSPNQERIIKERSKALKKLITTPAKERKHIFLRNPISKHLKDLADIESKLQDQTMDLARAKDERTIRNGPKYDETPTKVEPNSFYKDNQTQTPEQAEKEKQPYGEPITDDEIKNSIKKNLKSKDNPTGPITEENLKHLQDIEKIEKNDKGVQGLINKVVACLAGVSP
jgi:hypothetical protein